MRVVEGVVVDGREEPESGLTVQAVLYTLRIGEFLTSPFHRRLHLERCRAAPLDGDLAEVPGGLE